MNRRRPRMLAVVARFKWVHIDYLLALGEHFDVHVAWSGEGGIGPIDAGIEAGVEGTRIGWVRDDGADAVRARLADVIAEWRPDVVHVMYYNHEDLTLMARELAPDVPLVFECRDPATTLAGASPGHWRWEQEGRALAAADRHVFISEAQRRYYEEGHGLPLADTSIVIPYAFAGNTLAPPSPKLSAEDGRVHIALVGTADDQPDHGRWYVDIIRRLTGMGFVVHSHFHDLERFGVSLQPYRDLAEELPGYHMHPTVRHRGHTQLSELMSRYDLMGVFHELEANHHNESATLAVCMPTKSVCGWFHGAIPVVCFPHYRGVVERIERYDIGYVIEGWDDLAPLATDPAPFAAVSERCLEVRWEFSTERAAERVAALINPAVS